MENVNSLLTTLAALSHLESKLPVPIKATLLPASIKLIIEGLVDVVQEVLNVVLALDPAAKDSPVVKALQDILAVLKSLGL